MEEKDSYTLHPVVLVVLGRHRSGRTTLARYLEEKMQFKRISMDDAVLEELAKGFGADAESFKSFYEIEKARMRPMVLEYADMRRMMSGKGYWLLKVLHQIPMHTNIVIEDVHYREEVKALSVAGARFFYLDISPEQQLERGGSDYIFDHPSENDLDNWDEWEPETVIDVDAVDEEMVKDFATWWLVQEGFLE